MAAILHNPEIVAAINSCTEIIPGMPATRANLKILLDRFSGCEHRSDGSDYMELVNEGPEWLEGGAVAFATSYAPPGEAGDALLLCYDPFRRGMGHAGSCIIQGILRY